MIKKTTVVSFPTLTTVDEIDHHQQHQQDDMNGYEQQQPTSHQLDNLPNEEELKQQEAFYQQQ